MTKDRLGRKVLSAFSVFISLLLFVSAVPASAHDGTGSLFSTHTDENGVFYCLKDDGTAVAVLFAGDAREIVIPERVSLAGVAYEVCAVGDGAFEGCSALESVLLPDTVRRIGAFAFFGCSSLKRVEASGVVETGMSAFDSTPFLESMGDFAVIGDVLLRYFGNDGVVRIPTGIGFISDAFAYCGGVETVIFSEGVSAVGNGAFAFAGDLKRVLLSSSVKSIGDMAFFGCSSLSEISMTASLEAVGIDAFASTPFYDSVPSHEGFRIIGDGILLGYDGVNWDVTVPSGVKYVSNAFFCNTAVRTVTLPESVKVLGSGAFSNCPSLVRVTADGLASIGGGAFKDCRELRSLILSSAAPQVGSEAFSSLSPLFAVYFSKGAQMGSFAKSGVPCFLADTAEG